jgi:hypothetical protein
MEITASALRCIGSTVLIAALIAALVGVSNGSDFVKFATHYTDYDGTKKDTNFVPLFIVVLAALLTAEICRGIALVVDRYGHVVSVSVAWVADAFSVSFLVVIFIQPRDSAWTVAFLFGLVFNIIADVINLSLVIPVPPTDDDSRENSRLVQQQQTQPEALRLNVVLTRASAPATAAPEPFA